VERAFYGAGASDVPGSEQSADALCEGIGLAYTHFRQRRIILPLIATDTIPFTFAVTYNN
jgi:hypothetical protein